MIHFFFHFYGPPGGGGRGEERGLISRTAAGNRAQLDIVIDILTKSVKKRTNFKTQFTKYTKYKLQLINQ